MHYKPDDIEAFIPHTVWTEQPNAAGLRLDGDVIFGNPNGHCIYVPNKRGFCTIPALSYDGKETVTLFIVSEDVHYFRYVEGTPLYNTYKREDFRKN